MQSRDFCFWLQGHFELNGSADVLDASQVDRVRAETFATINANPKAPTP